MGRPIAIYKMKHSETCPPVPGLGFTATLHRKVFIHLAHTVIYMGNTEKNTTGEYISCRMSENDVKRLDGMVGDGEFMNRSDVIRTAIREFLKER